jgi:hypothetical protein
VIPSSQELREMAFGLRHMHAGACGQRADDEGDHEQKESDDQ